MATNDGFHHFRSIEAISPETGQFRRASSPTYTVATRPDAVETTGGVSDAPAAHTVESGRGLGGALIRHLPFAAGRATVTQRYGDEAHPRPPPLGRLMASTDISSSIGGAVCDVMQLCPSLSRRSARCAARSGHAAVPDARPLRGGRGKRWDEASIRAVLVELLADHEVWPTCEEFAAMGAKHLREVIGRGRGAKWWAAEVGLPGGDRPRGGVRRWTEELIRATLTEFLKGRTTWPNWPEFNAAGLHAFREALRHYGGPEHWAQEMGVTLERPARPFRAPRPRPAPPPIDTWPLWTEARIASELATFLGARREWPRHAEFVEAGQKRLYQAVLRHGGTRRWARRMRVKRVKRHGGGGRLWTDDRIERELAKFLGDRDAWPASGDFEAAGKRQLLNAVRRYGGVARWAKRLGVKRRVPRRGRRSRRQRSTRPTERTRWDDARIEAAIAPLVRELGRWPTKTEFQRAGLRPALSAVYDHGGGETWRRRLGVAAKPFDGPLPTRRHWDQARVELELREFLRGRTGWPTYSEFKAAGAGALYSAVCRYGGLEQWRQRVGFD